MIDIDGMIGWLMQLVQDAHLTFGESSSREYGIAEMVFRHHLRTGEGKEDAAAFYFLECLLVQSRVAFQCVMQRPAVLGKGWRVKNNQIIGELRIDN